MSAAMQFVKDGDRTALESFSLAELKKADYQLGRLDLGSGYRKAIEDLITKLQSDKTAEPEPQNTSTDRPKIFGTKLVYHGLSVDFGEIWRRSYTWFSKK